MRDLLVRRVYTSFGISVVVELDFVKKTVSLVEKDGTPKAWMFKDRTPEYLNGWIAILKAMRRAVASAQKEMDAITKEEHEQFVADFMELDKALQKSKDYPSEAN